MSVQEKPAVQVAIDELAGEANSPAEQAQVAEWQAELDAERAEALGRTGLQTAELVDMGDGAFVAKNQADEMVKNGDVAEGVYKNGRRS